MASTGTAASSAEKKNGKNTEAAKSVKAFRERKVE